MREEFEAASARSSDGQKIYLIRELTSPRLLTVDLLSLSFVCVTQKVEGKERKIIDSLVGRSSGVVQWQKGEFFCLSLLLTQTSTLSISSVFLITFSSFVCKIATADNQVPKEIIKLHEEILILNIDLSVYLSS